MSPDVNECTYIMVKPDGVQQGLVGNIIARFEKRGLKLIALKLVHATPAHIEKHYEVWKETPFFPGLLKYMTSGPVVAMVWQGLAAVKMGRTMLGETNPLASSPSSLLLLNSGSPLEDAPLTKITGTIRGDFTLDIDRTVCHGSDSVENAEKEIKLWFPESVVQYEAALASWIFE